MKQPKTALLIARVPAALLKRIEATAQRCERTKSQEIRLRMEESLSRHSVLATSSVPAASKT